MTRRTYQQAQAWRAAAVALLAEVGVEVTNSGTGSDVTLIKTPTAQIAAYLTGSVSIGGPGPDADYLCEPLERHGLLNGWHPGSRGSGVVWVPQREGVPLTVAEVMNHCGPEESARRVAAAKVALAAMERRPDASISEMATATGSDLMVRLRDWRDELAASGKPHEVGPWLARELERRFPEVLSPRPPPEHVQALALAFSAMYSNVDGLRRLLRFTAPRAYGRLPQGPVAPAQFYPLAAEAVLETSATGTVLNAMRDERPRRIAEIDELAKVLTTDSGSGRVKS